VIDTPPDSDAIGPEAGSDGLTSDPARRPGLWPPRGSPWFGDYSIRDFATKFLIQQDDFAEVERYREANAAERAFTNARPAVALMGDSITDFWPLDAIAIPPGLRLLNRGIAGQNSSVMLLRFQADVIALAPAAVVILAGTNDLRAYVSDPDAMTEVTLERLGWNLAAMIDMAKGRGIAVAMSTLPPVGGELISVARSPRAVDAVNAWIRAFAETRGLPVADYYTALADGSGLLSPQHSDDGIHPNRCAYDLMAPALIGAIEALRLLPPVPDLSV